MQANIKLEWLDLRVEVNRLNSFYWGILAGVYSGQFETDIHEVYTNINAVKFSDLMLFLRQESLNFVWEGDL